MTLRLLTWLSETNVKMDGWKSIFPGRLAYFQVRTVSFRQGIHSKKSRIEVRVSFFEPSFFQSRFSLLFLTEKKMTTVVSARNLFFDSQQPNLLQTVSPPPKKKRLHQSINGQMQNLTWFLYNLLGFYCQFWTFFSFGWLDDWWPDWGCWVQAKHRLVPRGPNSCSSVSEVVSVRGSGFAPVNRGEVGFQKINGQLGWVITPDLGEGVMNITPKVWNISAMMLFFFWRHLWKVFSVGGFVDSMIHPKIIE